MNAPIIQDRYLMGLVADMATASALVKIAKLHQMSVCNSDKAQAVLDHLRSRRPVAVIIDWEHCEAEAFKLVKEMAADADLKKVPLIGFVKNDKSELIREAQKAGCDRVYYKTDFFRELPNLIVRYTS